MIKTKPKINNKMISSNDLLKRYISCCTSEWDLIIISSRDESQRKVFESQISEMRNSAKHSLATNIQFMVISDQQFSDESKNGLKNDLKLGSGGSTIHIFKYIAQQFGDNYFNNNKILLIHSGGYSQRLPHYSIVGKLFSSLPISFGDNKDKFWSSLDVKLALLSPLASKMKSGVWITASDDIVIYSYLQKELESLPQFSDDCFVCLGHPSSIDISVNHGVYVLPDEELNDINSSPLSIHNCLKVLQKPTLEQLIKYKAIINKDESHTNQFCITDSSYYIGSQLIVNKFLKFSTQTLESEIDCYGDFLCPLGSNPITLDDDNPYYSPLNDLLLGTQIKVLYLAQSKFFHLGTIAEYMYALTDYQNKELANSLSFKTVKTLNNSINGTIICSLINQNSKIDKNSLIEYCNFSQIPIETENNLLYNCIIEKRSDVSLSTIKFPPNYLIYSVPVIIDDKTKGWCTFGCQMNSKLKSSLWSAKLFPVCDTSSQSLIKTLHLIENQMNSDLFSQSIKLSMSDLKDVKDIDSILNIQNQLKSICL